ncbi:hypothetical protein MRB53_002663 [Persea americana]|uniref:Uncharacterized protein n=1 Tax=Persea americana TaxID=3435 RepID=A0ACC2MW37_PERAE|nr:hypothetical protein MRB53_002663 [Persea americana]|eukprot:TRINITY_DN23132_c0_g1_i1.p1 TRINITY_DN23132_c0_g1~~TRINITY_DN23132_c0_g1_i1.p1  ORF type:complete len:364 (+),score=70.28 TRINITY_DN23132_c0_g1_i1:113-1093(+)
MDESISIFCKTLASFCKNTHSTSQALKDSTDRRPIPLDSASSTFIQCLNRRVSSVSSDLNLLESMVLETVSFEELLGHCNEVYKKNQNDLQQLQDRLQTSFGYVPDIKMDEEVDISDLATPTGITMKFLSPKGGLDYPSIDSGQVRRRLEEDPIFDDSICIQDLGLSDAGLATLASEANDELASPEASPQNSMSYDYGKRCEKKIGYKLPSEALGKTGTPNHCPLASSTTQTILKISNDDYDKLPSYMKSLAPWEDLQAAVVKMNSVLCEKEKPMGGYSLDQDEIASLELGSKARSYLLMLLRMSRLLVETIDGSIVYRVIYDTCQ